MSFFDNNVPYNASFRTVNGYVGTATLSGVAVRATSYIAQASAAQRSVSSTNANDVAAGTGARSITVTYYDNSLNGPFTEIVTLNGTTPVNTVASNIRYIEKIEVTTVGSVGSNVGTIQLFTAVAAGGSVFGSIAASDNITFWAHHYVATGMTAYIRSMRASATIAAGGATLQASGDPNSTNSPFMNVTGMLRHDVTSTQLTWDPPISVIGPNFVIVNERSDVITPSTTYVSFDYVEF